MSDTHRGVLHAFISLAIFSCALIGAGCSSPELPGIPNIDVTELLDDDDSACEAVLRCMLDHCSVPTAAHEARQAAVFDGCLQICEQAAAPEEPSELDRLESWHLWRCESGAADWDDRCDELAMWCSDE